MKSSRASCTCWCFRYEYPLYLRTIICLLRLCTAGRHLLYLLKRYTCDHVVPCRGLYLVVVCTLSWFVPCRVCTLSWFVPFLCFFAWYSYVPRFRRMSCPPFSVHWSWIRRLVPAELDESFGTCLAFSPFVLFTHYVPYAPHVPFIRPMLCTLTSLYRWWVRRTS